MKIKQIARPFVPLERMLIAYCKISVCVLRLVYICAYLFLFIAIVSIGTAQVVYTEDRGATTISAGDYNLRSIYKGQFNSGEHTHKRKH